MTDERSASHEPGHLTSALHPQELQMCNGMYIHSIFDGTMHNLSLPIKRYRFLRTLSPWRILKYCRIDVTFFFNKFGDIDVTFLSQTGLASSFNRQWSILYLSEFYSGQSWILCTQLKFRIIRRKYHWLIISNRYKQFRVRDQCQG